MLTFIDVNEVTQRTKSMSSNGQKISATNEAMSVLGNLYTICCDCRFLWEHEAFDEKRVHINVYQSDRNQTNNSSPQRNIDKYYTTNHNVPMMEAEWKRIVRLHSNRNVINMNVIDREPQFNCALNSHIKQLHLSNTFIEYAKKIDEF